MRGRLIFPFVIALKRLDPAAMEAAGPGGADGFDDDFNEPILETSGETSIPLRRELPEILLRAQIEPGTFANFRRLLQGFAPDAEMSMTLGMPELEDLGLIGADGFPLIRVGDRIDRIEDLDGVTVLTIADPPGIFVRSVTPESFGFSGARRPNLAIMTLSDRPQGTSAARPQGT